MTRYGSNTNLRLKIVQQNKPCATARNSVTRGSQINQPSSTARNSVTRGATAVYNYSSNIQARGEQLVSKLINSSSLKNFKVNMTADIQPSTMKSRNSNINSRLGSRDMVPKENFRTTSKQIERECE